MEDVHAQLTAKRHHFLANNVWRARKQQQAAGDTLEEDEVARGITRISYASKKKKYIGLVPPPSFVAVHLGTTSTSLSHTNHVTLTPSATALRAGRSLSVRASAVLPASCTKQK